MDLRWVPILEMALVSRLPVSCRYWRARLNPRTAAALLARTTPAPRATILCHVVQGIVAPGLVSPSKASIVLLAGNNNSATAFQCTSPIVASNSLQLASYQEVTR